MAMIPRLSSSLNVRIAVLEETPAISANSARESSTSFFPKWRINRANLSLLDAYDRSASLFWKAFSSSESFS